MCRRWQTIADTGHCQRPLRLTRVITVDDNLPGGAGESSRSEAHGQRALRTGQERDRAGVSDQRQLRGATAADIVNDQLNGADIFQYKVQVLDCSRRDRAEIEAVVVLRGGRIIDREGRLRCEPGISGRQVDQAATVAVVSPEWTEIDAGTEESLLKFSGGDQWKRTAEQRQRSGYMR